MTENKTTLLAKIGKREYQLVCDSDSSLSEFYEAIALFNKFVTDKINEVSESPKNEKQEVI